MQYQRLGSSGLKVSKAIVGCMSYGSPGRWSKRIENIVGILPRPWNKRNSKREEHDGFLKSTLRSRENEVNKQIVDRLEEVAEKRGVSMTCIATAWSISKGHCPIIGLSSKERVEQAMANSSYQLRPEDAEYLEEPYLPKEVQGIDVGQQAK